jgi:16S rRNA (guanine527-N7)-methyltransferase
LEEARVAGFVGPAPVAGHIDHAEAVANLIGPPPGDWLDLGSGAGVPGLFLALSWTAVKGALVESNGRRCEFLREAIDRLVVGGRVDVIQARAEKAAHEPKLRGRFALVVARGFGRPATTAECAAGFLHEGGRLVVSEPPGSDDSRWDAAGLERLGLGAAEIQRSSRATLASMRLLTTTDERWPRRVGVPGKRPLW